MRNNINARPARKNVIDASFMPSLNFDQLLHSAGSLPEILFITSYPPRECGLATYSQDLINALQSNFEQTFSIRICALENNFEKHEYPHEVKYILNTQRCEAYSAVADTINRDRQVSLVVFQHEFGLFADCPVEFRSFLKSITKKKVMVFHTVLPKVDLKFRENVIAIAEHSDAVVSMTQNSADILSDVYGIDQSKISVIAHGTHLVPHLDKTHLRKKYQLANKKILTTFGLLSSGKSIETSLDALPKIAKANPDVIFLILGKTHPGVVKSEGEKYREFLEQKVKDLKLENHVRFVNKYLKLDELLEYLQLTDIYLFTSKDRDQAVSGTFAYAASCGCAIVSTPIPPAIELLRNNGGILIDFENPEELASAVNKLIADDQLRDQVKVNALHKITATSWQNTAAAHVRLFEELTDGEIEFKMRKPPVSLEHIKRMTTNFGMLQFSKLNHPDPESGYTIDDNSRAMVAMCEHYEIGKDEESLEYIKLYLEFMAYCQRNDGRFLNFIDVNKKFSDANDSDNLDDANGRAAWALGFLISLGDILPRQLTKKAEMLLEKLMPHIEDVHSTRAMAFCIKGLYYYNLQNHSTAVRTLIRKLADRLTKMFLHESTRTWIWFESYMTYANSVLPESLLYAYLETREPVYLDVAKSTFDFYLTQVFTDEGYIKVISNRSWLVRGESKDSYGEQPIDVAYTILALSQFAQVFRSSGYDMKLQQAFEWFLGRNHLNQIVYNPCTGGCYDGLEEDHVNLNQGAESAVSYLLARLTIEKNEKLRRARDLGTIKISTEKIAFKA